jgi:RNA polymerase sigma-70 factor, ECF subfamily
MHLSSRDEILTVLRAQSGEIGALDRFFRSVQKPLFLRVFSIVGHRELAEDVVQDVFILLQGKLKWLRDPRYFRAWAFRIAAREAFRGVAKEKRRSGTGGDDALSEVADPREPELARAVVAAQLPDLVRQLPPGSRAVLTLHYLNDLPLAEVAQVLNLPVGTAKSRLSYGLSILRRQLRSDQRSID